MPAQVRGGLPAVLLTALMIMGALLPVLDSSSGTVSADSLPIWSKTLRLHEGLPSDEGDYDWLNSSAAQNPSIPYLDYDADGDWGISIGKPLPSERWQHFWVLDPAVNDDVRIQGNISARVWAAAEENSAGYIMTVKVSDMGPGEWGVPASWTQLTQVTAPILGPVYSTIKLHELSLPAVDYVLAVGHQLVMTIVRNDTMPSKHIFIVYDSDLFDSYITVPFVDFVEVTDAWAEDSASVARDTFSDAEVMTVRANVSDPFGSYDISGAECTVRNSSDGSVVVPATSMSVSAVAPGDDSSWVLFEADIGPLAGGSYLVTVNGSDPMGSPTWMNFSISVISIDRFSVTAPSAITAFSEFEVTVTALDSLGAVVPEWRGTVDLAAFQADMVTPADGALSVSSIEFTGAEGGTVTVINQTYDLGEDVIVIRAESDSHI
ncbi:MAG: hypothetical protein QG582_36, partial [Candidatus Thermoplasmatota archaeon]|nr:hypothetical protein [Candidatus Thermoplasmatota archaeon]